MSRLEATRRAVDVVRSAILVWLAVAGVATLVSTVIMWRTWARGFHVRDAAAVVELGSPAGRETDAPRLWKS